MADALPIILKRLLEKIDSACLLIEILCGSLSIESGPQSVLMLTGEQQTSSPQAAPGVLCGCRLEVWQ